MIPKPTLYGIEIEGKYSNPPGKQQRESGILLAIMATKEIKQKKGLLGFYKFNITGKNHIKAKQGSVESTQAPKTEHKAVANSLLLKKLENCQDLVLEQDGRRRIERGGGGDGGRGGGRGGIVEARKSVSHVETNLSSVASFLQVKVLVSDMPGFMQVHAFRCARRTYDSLEKFSSKHMAYNMKKMKKRQDLNIELLNAPACSQDLIHYRPPYFGM